MSILSIQISNLAFFLPKVKKRKPQCESRIKQQQNVWTSKLYVSNNTQCSKRIKEFGNKAWNRPHKKFNVGLWVLHQTWGNKIPKRIFGEKKWQNKKKQNKRKEDRLYTRLLRLMEARGETHQCFHFSPPLYFNKGSFSMLSSCKMQTPSKPCPVILLIFNHLGIKAAHKRCSTTSRMWMSTVETH